MKNSDKHKVVEGFKKNEVPVGIKSVATDVSSAISALPLSDSLARYKKVLRTPFSSLEEVAKLRETKLREEERSLRKKKKKLGLL